jgi:hypothetical protein
MHFVKATREGLIGARTASGYLIDAIVPFVALPAVAALRQSVYLVNPRNGCYARAIVLDVGPWNEHDHAYVFGEARPQAESGVDSRGRTTNLAGIDLSEAVWRKLEMTDNDIVGWEFASL